MPETLLSGFPGNTDMSKSAKPNPLNDLTGTEWIKFTRTWFVCDSPRYHRNRDTELHPARFPEEMVADFLRFFTKRGGWVLDPFLGSGATLVACLEEGRNGVGIELSERYAAVAAKRLDRIAREASQQLALPEDGRAGSLPPPLCHAVIPGDALDAGRAEFWAEQRPALEEAGLRFRRALPQFDFLITSPPYWRMLRTSRGGVESKHKQRVKAGLDDHYSDSPDDLGNVADYPEFVAALGRAFDAAARCLKSGGYLVAVVQNLRAPDGEVKMLAWDLARRIGRKLLFQGERIWCQNTKPLGIWGYPKVFVPNYHHHYCLVFRKA
jgi:SAM-dependent methyltransferase